MSHGRGMNWWSNCLPRNAQHADPCAEKARHAARNAATFPELFHAACCFAMHALLARWSPPACSPLRTDQ
eukprot:10523953-Alexandrium_andersonii.AAC.1